MALYITREGPFATVDVFTNLAQFAGQTVNAITVPTAYGAIKEIWVAHGPDGAATSGTGTTFTLRLQGSGLKYGPVDIVVGGFAGTATGNDSIADLAYSAVYPVDIALNPGGDIWVKAGSAGAATTGTPEMAVTLVFVKGGAGVHYYVARDMSTLGANNTVYAMTHNVDDAAAGRIQVPAGCNRITKMWSSFAGVLADNTGGSLAVKLRGNGLRDGDIVLPVGGYSNQVTGTGYCGGRVYAGYVPTDLAVVPGNNITVEAVFAGTDVTSDDVAISLEFSG